MNDLWLLHFARDLHIEIRLLVALAVLGWLIEILLQRDLAAVLLLAVTVQWFKDVLTLVTRDGVRAILMVLLLELNVDRWLITPCVWSELVWQGTDLRMRCVKDCSFWTLDWEVFNRSDSLRLTHHVRAPEVSDEELTDRIWGQTFIILAAAVDHEEWQSEDEDPEEHPGKACQYLIVSVDTVPEHQIRLIQVLLDSLKFKLCQYALL